MAKIFISESMLLSTSDVMQLFATGGPGRALFTRREKSARPLTAPVRAEIRMPFERQVSGCGQTKLNDRDGVGCRHRSSMHGCTYHCAGGMENVAR